MFPAHPAPVALEADGTMYIACSMPDTGRGFFHSTYYADVDDNNGQRISLRGIEKLIITNLPKEVDAPMPSSLPAIGGKDIDGETIQEGHEYAWSDGNKAQLENGKWTPIKSENTVCESDDKKKKREAREVEEQKTIADKAEAKREAQQAELRAKTPCPAILTSASGDILEEPLPAAIGRPECEGHLPTRVATSEEHKQLAKIGQYSAAFVATPSATGKTHVYRWAIVTNTYTQIYKRCHVNVSQEACEYHLNDEVATLHKGDKVQIVSSKTRASDSSEIYEVKFQHWTGWMLSTDLELQ